MVFSSTLDSKMVKVYLIVIMAGLSLPLILYSGTIDAFAPIQSLQIIKINHFGHFSEDVFSYVPFFYIFGSMCSIVLDLPVKEVIFFPVQTLVGIFSFLLFFQRLSKNLQITGIITLIYALSDTTGNKFFFWPHGMGMALLFLMAYLYINLLENKHTKESQVLLAVLVIALMYYSYDIFLLFLLLTVGLILILVCNAILQRSLSIEAKTSRNALHTFTIIALFSFIVLFGISDFVYGTLIDQTQYFAGISFAFDKLIHSYFSVNAGVLPYKEELVSYPALISLTSAIKYLIFFLAITVSVVTILRRVYAKNTLNMTEIIVLSFLFMAGGYFVARSILGYLLIPIFFIPGLICITYLYSYFRSNAMRIAKTGCMLLLLLILILNCTYYSTYVSNDLIDRESNYFEYVLPISDWHHIYCNPASIVTTDVQTKNLILMNTYERKLNAGEDQPIKELTSSTYQAMDPSREVPILLNKEHGGNPYNKYYIINYRLNTLTLEQWVTLKSWRDSRARLDANPQFKKIYSTGDLVILN